MTDDHTPAYGESAEPEQPAEPWADQPALFEEPTPTPHDEPAAEPEGSWQQPADELTWEAGAEPGEPETWQAMPHATGEEPLPEPDPGVEPEPDLEPEPDPEPEPEVHAAEPAQPVVAQQALLAPVVGAGAATGDPEHAHEAVDWADEDEDRADQDEDVEDEVEQGEQDSSDEREGGRLLPALSVLVAALVLLTAWLGYTVADNRGAEPIASTRASALAAGRDAARLVFSYDYRHLDKDFAAARAVTTGKFRTDYVSTTTKLVGDVAPRYKAVLLAEVSEAGVITASSNRVQLLVFLDVQSTSTLAATPKITPRRLKMTMVRSGDRWLVSAVDAF